MHEFLYKTGKSASHLYVRTTGETKNNCAMQGIHICIVLVLLIVSGLMAISMEINYKCLHSLGRGGNVNG